MANKDIMALTDHYVMKTYGRFPLALVRGSGMKVWDADGVEYLDFVAGLAVCSLGHCHPAVVKAICDQASTLIHVSNFYHIEPQARLARLLIDNSDFDKAFFCNSGAEANEAAVKLARKYSKTKYGEGRYEVITAERSFHGRTLAMITATGQAKYQKGFEPLPVGFSYVPYNDLESLKAKITAKTCAIMLEPVQGEGGVYPLDSDYAAGVYALCKEKDILLIMDEVQTGIGRTGKLFGYQHFHGVRPDIITLAKALAGGTAIGAMLATDEVAKAFEPGNHASTFGGNPLACAAGIAALTTVIDEDIPSHAEEMGNYLKSRLAYLGDKHGCIVDIRGLGLIIGAEFSIDTDDLTRRAREAGVLINSIGGKVLRFIPPLIVTKEDIDRAIAVLDSLIPEVMAA